MKAEVLHLLERSRRRLNLILTFIKTVKITGLAGSVSGVLILISRLLGWPGASVNIWLAVIFLSIAGGLAWGWHTRINIMTTARWLDEKEQTAEAFSAALICLERDCTRLCDHEIVARAETIARAYIMDKHKMAWPIRYLLKQTLIATGLILSATLILLFWPIIPDRSMDLQNKPNQMQKNTLYPKNLPSNTVARLSPQITRQLAKQLFPQDAKMAVAAEKALKSGDISQIKAIMEQSAIKLEEKPEQNNAVTKRNAAQSQALSESEQHLRMLRSYVDSLSASTNVRRKNENSSQELKSGSKKTSGSKETSLDQLIADQKAGKNSSLKGLNIPWPQMNPGNKDSQNQSASGDLKKGTSNEDGGGPGTGSENKKVNRGEITARSDTQKPAIIQGQNNPTLEYILPGKNAMIPLSEVLPDSRRAAEEALNRSEVPLEYSDFVRLYFLKLSQEIK